MTLLPNRNELKAEIPIPVMGLNTADDASQMNQLYAQDLQNVVIDDFVGYAKRSGYTRFNTGMLPVTFTGSISSITSQSVSGATGVVWAGIVTAGMRFRLASGTNIYTISGLVSNAHLSLTEDYMDDIKTGSYYISCPQVDGLYRYKHGTTQKLIAFGGGTAFNGGASSTGEFAKLNASLKNGEWVSAVQYQGKLIFCNGYQFQKYDGDTTIDAVAGSPVPSDPVYVSLYTIGNANFVCAIGSNTLADRSRFSFSDVNAIGTWPAANRYFAGDGDGGVCTGGVQCPNGFLVFKDNGIFMFGGIPGQGSLKKLSSIGCPCPKTIMNYKGQVFFVGNNAGRLGVYVYAGGNDVQCISDVVEPTMNEARKAYLANICAGISDNKYIVSYTSSTKTYNDSHILFYLNRGTRDDKNRVIYPAVKGSRGMNVLAEVEISGESYLLSGSPTAGFVYQEDNGTSNDTTDNIYGDTAAIESYVKTKWFDFGRIDVKKELLYGFINAKALGDWNLNFDLFTDFQMYGHKRFPVNINNEISTWADVVFLQTPWQTASEQKVTEFKMPYPTFGKYFAFRWCNALEDEYFTVFPTTIKYKEEAM
jgi:hypothetical protein